MKYRHEIDGLRAIAVMGVILYHVGLKSISAGYAGVDVFFVISGFLIGGIILRQRSAGTFRYWDFYSRRARRILPALFVVILCSIAAGWLFMMPDIYRYFGGAVFSTLLFISNIWFFEIIDYFNPAALKSPLIHTWSLAVEEQFYIFVPLLFGVLWRFGLKAVTGVFALLAVISIATAIYTNVDQPMAAFYLIHTRAWELFFGVLAALVFSKLTVTDQTAGRLSNLGLVLILGGLCLIPAHVPWPGLWTVIPVTGTALVLLFGAAPSLSQKILRLRPLTVIGLISYSAYLWHQPVISFLELSGYKVTGWLQAAGIIAAILGLSWVSWRFVEQPFRTKTPDTKWFKRLSLIMAGLLITAFSIGDYVTEGYPKRVSSDVRDILAYKESYSVTYRKCIAVRKTVASLNNAERCVHGADTEPTIAVWGDSHAARLSLPLGTALGNHNLALRELSLSSCQPIPGLLNYGQKRAAACEKYNTDVLNYILATPTLKTIVMKANWGNYISEAKRENWLGEGVDDGFHSYPRNSDPWMPDSKRKEAIGDALRTTIKALTDNGRSVILIQAAPWPGFDVPEYYSRKLWYGETLAKNIAFDEMRYSNGTMDVRDLLSDVAIDAGAVVFDPASVLCAGGQCRVIENGELLYSDGNHLSLPGIALFLPSLVEVIVKTTP